MLGSMEGALDDLLWGEGRRLGVGRQVLQTHQWLSHIGYRCLEIPSVF
jgi:hypothetical protein